MIDTTQTGPDTLTGRYLRRFWHPVFLADRLAAGRAVPLTILGSKLALYRGKDGAVHCVDNRCAHRGAMLSVGHVEGDMIRCPYHGWAYGPDGQCRHQPFETAAYAKRIRIGGYPARDYLGLIFVYLGEGEPPEFPLYPELEGAAFVVPMIEDIPCNWFQHVENQLDQGHVWITHAASPPTGIDPVPSLPKIAAKPTEWGICLTSTPPGARAKLMQFGMPNMGLFAIFPEEIPGQKDAVKANRSWQLFLGYRVPVDDGNHLQVSVVAVFADADQADAARAVWTRFEAGSPGAHRTAQAVLAGTIAYADIAKHCAFPPLAQDLVVLLAQGTIAERGRGAEHLGASDVGVAALRKLYSEELSAFAEGRPLRAFRRPDGLLPLPD